MCGVVCTSEENTTLVWPPITSIIDGPPPLNGTCSMSTPASSLNSSPPRCWNEPTPADAYWTSPGLDLASATSSLIEFTGRVGFTATTFGPEPITPIGANALIGSYGSL